jgi:hypothetical protein
MRSEEQIWKLLFYIGIECLRLSKIFLLYYFLRKSMNLDFEKVIDRKQDFSTTLEILCEEFRVVDQVKVSKKRTKRKSRRHIKTNEVCFKNQKRKKDFEKMFFYLS